MWEDPIVAEVRKIRDRHAAAFNYDLDAIFQDLKKQEKRAGGVLLHFLQNRRRIAQKSKTAQHDESDLLNRGST